MKVRITVFWFLVAMYCVSLTEAMGAVGCTLNDPDRDIQRIFPEGTGYKTEFISIKEKGGLKLEKEVEAKLGDKLDSLYEVEDVPYAYYTVLKGKIPIGRIHGVNQKGMYGGMQIILATDLEGKVLDFYYQKISSPEARRFRDKSFTDNFKGITLADFYSGDSGSGPGRIAKIMNPTERSHEDFKATLRSIKKNLILLDIFKLDRKHDSLIRGGENYDKED